MFDVGADGIVGILLIVVDSVVVLRGVVVIGLVGALVEVLVLVVVAPGSGATVINSVFSFTQNVAASWTNVALF